jgi:hypothetical protein
MPIHVTWLYNLRVILAEDIGVITLPELKQANAQVLNLLNQGVAPVHLIIDVSALEQYPRTPSTLSEALSFSEHPHLGKVVICGFHNQLLRVVLSVLSRLLSVEPHFSSSVQDSMVYIASRDPTLTKVLRRPNSDDFDSDKDIPSSAV